MRSTKQLYIEEEIDNTQQKDKQPKLNLEKVMVRNLVKVKSRIRAGVGHGECGTCHCVVA
jgi:hypothetical protein